jgi:isopenicillin N synthase-like dioxygenase
MTAPSRIAASLRAERLSLDQVPVVDFRPFREGDPGERKRAALELAGTLRNMSFAYLAGHGVNQG